MHTRTALQTIALALLITGISAAQDPSVPAQEQVVLEALLDKGLITLSEFNECMGLPEVTSQENTGSTP